MRRIFMVAGELSGDLLGAWYVRRFLDLHKTSIDAVGGTNLEQSGAKLYSSYHSLNATGIVEVLRHIPHLLRFIQTLANDIIANTYDEVILVDFPGFNLRLAKILKKRSPKLRITYLNPPQLWAWGAWRLKKLVSTCTTIIVIYPFEVAWYKKQGVTVFYHGNPIFDSLQSHITHPPTRENKIILLPGSRRHEIEHMLPSMIEALKIFIRTHPHIRIVMPLTPSCDRFFVLNVLKEHGLEDEAKQIEFLTDPEKRFYEMQSSLIALTKPGTTTLELSLLGVPALVVFKTSWLTYFIARFLVKVKYMALPNLLNTHPIYPELIQSDCTAANIAKHLALLHAQIASCSNQIPSLLSSDFTSLRSLFSTEEKKDLSPPC